MRPTLSCVYGPVEYREYREQLEEIDRILREGKLEELFVCEAVKQFEKKEEFVSWKQRLRYVKSSRLALRCNLARKLTGLGYREFSVRMCESELLQWFCGTAELGYRRGLSKSTLDRFEHWVDKETLGRIGQEVLARMASGDKNLLDADVKVDVSEVFSRKPAPV